MKTNLKNKKLLIISSIISALLIVVINKLNIDLYIKRVIIPFIIMLINFFIILKDINKNKKALLYLIPLLIILLAPLILNIDYTNKVINIFLIPLLLSVLFLSLINKNYKISSLIFNWLYTLFPKDIFYNLEHLNIDMDESKKTKLSNIGLGILFGSIIGLIILTLLTQADDYFGAFVNNITKLFKFDIQSIIIFVISFLILFTTGVNLIKNTNTKIKKVKAVEMNKTIIITLLAVINSVFVLFLISEISRVSTNFLQIPLEYTYSSYAREGFFQLLIVTAINFSILMYINYGTNIIKNNKSAKILSSLLIIFSVILIFNSYYRMYLYINHYGFTILRLQVMLFLTMELIIFTLLILKTTKDIKYKDAYTYFIIAISTYIINLCLCTENFINILN